MIILSVLSYGAGQGYVYILWHDIQLQTNLWVMVLWGLFISFVFQVIWLWFKRFTAKVKRQKNHLLSFDQLHPYEQLGVIGILQGGEEQREFIQQKFDQSGLLKHVIFARILSQQNKFSEALKVLEQSPAAAFELAEIVRIEVYLAQQDGTQALTHLEFLTAHDLSPWLSQLEQTFRRHLSVLWGDFATRFPWLYLGATQVVALTSEAKVMWLTQLLVEFDQAEDHDLVRIKQCYENDVKILYTLPYKVKKLWLKVLMRLPELTIQHEELALYLLEQQFDQEVFYSWFQQQLLKQNPNYKIIEQQLNQFELQYPSIPVFTFARWHLYRATERMDEASQLLSLYPDNVLMNYLRVKAELKENNELIQQLNSIYEKDTNFTIFKI